MPLQLVQPLREVLFDRGADTSDASPAAAGTAQACLGRTYSGTPYEAGPGGGFDGTVDCYLKRTNARWGGADAAPQPFVGQIAELLVFRGIGGNLDHTNVDTRRKLELYLSAKWGLGVPNALLAHGEEVHMGNQQLVEVPSKNVYGISMIILKWLSHSRPGVAASQNIVSCIDVFPFSFKLKNRCDVKIAKK